MVLNYFLPFCIVLIVIALLMQWLFLRKLHSQSSLLETLLREELRLGRSELRENFESLYRQNTDQRTMLSQQFIELTRNNEEKLSQSIQLLSKLTDTMRTDTLRMQTQISELLSQRLGEMASSLALFGSQQETRLDNMRQDFSRFSTSLQEQFEALQQRLTEDARKSRQELVSLQQHFSQALHQQLLMISQRSEEQLQQVQHVLQEQLRALRTENGQHLESMRTTVDEKLHTTLNTRLDASFKLVSERLEQVQRGLGEMQQLATGVGDLKRLLTNIKTRGNWGEVQFESILEQTLTPEQYGRQVCIAPDRTDCVDFAVRLPGRESTKDAVCWLPIDVKFPREDYERLLEAEEHGDSEKIKSCGMQLERAIRVQAQSISTKYIVQPYTTDFAVMFLPTEGLYAEAIRRVGLVDALQREFRIVLAGPTTVTALLNSLQMGFRTLAIEKRSSEVWGLLGGVKNELGKFAGILEKAEKQISTVSRSIGDASRKTRTIERRLRSVESLPLNTTPEEDRDCHPEEILSDA